MLTLKPVTDWLAQHKPKDFEIIQNLSIWIIFIDVNFLSFFNCYSRENPDVVLLSKAVIGDHSPPPVMVDPATGNIEGRQQTNNTVVKTLMWCY